MQGDVKEVEGLMINAIGFISEQKNTPSTFHPRYEQSWGKERGGSLRQLRGKNTGG